MSTCPSVCAMCMRVCWILIRFLFNIRFCFIFEFEKSYQYIIRMRALTMRVEFWTSERYFFFTIQHNFFFLLIEFEQFVDSQNCSMPYAICLTNAHSWYFLYDEANSCFYFPKFDMSFVCCGNNNIKWLYNFNWK